MTIHVRPEQAADTARIREVTELAFDPRFYARFGFQSDSLLVVPEAPPEVTLSLRFHACVDHGTVAFHPAFLLALAGAEEGHEQQILN